MSKATLLLIPSLSIPVTVAFVRLPGENFPVDSNLVEEPTVFTSSVCLSNRAATLKRTRLSQG